MSNKFVPGWIPVWDKPALESYYEEMARKGYHLKECSAYGNSFEIGKPESRKFLVLTGQDNDPEQIKYYNDKGWRIDGYYAMHRILSAEEGTPYPVDPLEISLKWDAELKKKKSAAIYKVIICGNFAAFLSIFLRVLGYIGGLALVVGFLAIAAIRAAGNIIRIMKIRDDIIADKSEITNWRKQALYSKIMWGATVLVFVVYCIMYFIV